MGATVRHNARPALAAGLATVHVNRVSGRREDARQQQGKREAFHMGLRLLLRAPGEKSQEGDVLPLSGRIGGLEPVHAIFLG